MSSTRSLIKMRAASIVRLLFVVGMTGAFAFCVAWWSRSASLPGPVVSSSRKPVSMNQCADCHREVCESFQHAPHRHTLTRANDPAMLARFSGHDFQRPGDGLRFRFVTKNHELWLEADAYPDAVRVDWIFGSGRHANTPVSVWENPDGQTELLQHRVSWYPHAGLGLTLGLDDEPLVASGLEAIGKPLEHPDAMECFGCHTTHLPHRSGRIDPDNIVTGVRCERCHPGGERHVNEILNGTETMERWSRLSPLESVNRCGECHRRADQLAPVDLNPDRKVLVRFASVGLAMSPCFRHQDEVTGASDRPVRFDCLTCHNPHRPADTDPRFYTATCLLCHGAAKDDAVRRDEETPRSPRHGVSASPRHQSSLQEAVSRRAPVCSSQPMTSQCLTCHMPKIEVQQHLFFTDHWIRVR